jgi:hypothetical protein
VSVLHVYSDQEMPSGDVDAEETRKGCGGIYLLALPVLLTDCSDELESSITDDAIDTNSNDNASVPRYP